jgi:hypothetical protein
MLAILVIAGVWTQQATAQNRPGGPPGGAPPGANSEEGRQRMEQFRQQMSERLRESLGATPDEWKVLQPMIEKVQTLQNQARAGSMGRPGGPGNRQPGDRQRGDRPQSDRPQSDRPQSDIEKTTEALQTLLQNKEAKTQDIKAALDALREARAKVKAEVEAAQKELRAVVTVHQEAQLVLMRVLD